MARLEQPIALQNRPGPVHLALRMVFIALLTATMTIGVIAALVILTA